MFDGLKIYLKHTNLRVSQTLEIKISPKLYWKYTSYLEYGSIFAGQNTNKRLHSLWSNGLVVRVQVYQTKNPRFKTIRWLKNYLSFHSLKVCLMNIKDSWGLGPHSDSVTYRQLNYIHKWPTETNEP